MVVSPELVVEFAIVVFTTTKIAYHKVIAIATIFI
jgi:hypothetical protein